MKFVTYVSNQLCRFVSLGLFLEYPCHMDSCFWGDLSQKNGKMCTVPDIIPLFVTFVDPAPVLYFRLIIVIFLMLCTQFYSTIQNGNFHPGFI